jgi:hypothetical protein
MYNDDGEKRAAKLCLTNVNEQVEDLTVACLACRSSSVYFAPMLKQFDFRRLWALIDGFKSFDHASCVSNRDGHGSGRPVGRVWSSNIFFQVDSTIFDLIASLCRTFLCPGFYPSSLFVKIIIPPQIRLICNSINVIQFRLNVQLLTLTPG